MSECLFEVSRLESSLCTTGIGRSGNSMGLPLKYKLVIHMAHASLDGSVFLRFGSKGGNLVDSSGRVAPRGDHRYHHHVFRVGGKDLERRGRTSYT